ncbi:unnamed protein product, partial [Trichogramma brassicae]
MNPTERANRTIKTMIASYVGANHRDWDKHLHELRHAMNTAVQSSTRVYRPRSSTTVDIRVPEDRVCVLAILAAHQASPYLATTPPIGPSRSRPRPTDGTRGEQRSAWPRRRGGPPVRSRTSCSKQDETVNRPS